MNKIFEKMNHTLRHLESLHEIFMNQANFQPEERRDHDLYVSNEVKLKENLNRLDLDSLIYGQKGRQMILADLLEYIFLGRGYYSIQTREDRSNFIKIILYFANLLMCYEVITVSKNLRNIILDKLAGKITGFNTETYFNELKNFSGKVGLKKGESDASEYLDKYFDSLLPKTAGGLWHELLVYVFMLRNDVGYIIPLLLSQRLMGFHDSLVPPDFLVITPDKRIYGIEVGTKKEIQSGIFSLQTTIPTATIDTENSRVSDRCPICKRWIPFCEFIIENYANFDIEIKKAELRCLDECTRFTKEQIASGECPYTKYSRKKAQTMEHTHHNFADGLHYHYKCVLENISAEIKSLVISAQDSTALKTHYPYYSGLEELIK